MFEPFRTLRFKLTLIYVVIFGLIQLVLWSTVDVARSRYLRGQFDATLLERALSMAEMVETAALDRPATHPTDLETHLRAFQTPGLFFELVGADGVALVQSPNLQGFHLPRDPSATQPLHNVPGASVGTISGNVADVLTGRGNALRAVLLQRRPEGRPPYTLVTAASLAPLHTALWEIRVLLVTFAVVSLVVAAITSWYTAGRSLAPVGAIARQARTLSAARLGERLPVPPTHDEIAEMVVVINGMLERLEAEFRNQQRFMSDVSHELKTPLAVLLGEAQSRLRRPDAPGHPLEFIETVQGEVRRLLRVVESYLILMRTQSGARPAVLAQVCADVLIIAAIRNCQPEAQSRNVRLLPQLERNEPAPVLVGDVDLLTAMVEQLVRSGVRHSPEGEAVTVLVSSTPDEVRFRVRDCGAPIPPEYLDRIFDLFYHASPRSAPAARAGIGLSIAKGVAQLHGGTITARNLPDRGVECEVCLPRAAEVDPADSRVQTTKSVEI